MLKTTLETVCPTSQQDWRQWLQANHQTQNSVWLIYYKKNSGMPTLSWSQAVDEALCFGWIDSTAKPIDDKKFMQFFCKRKPNSVWSKINKEKVQRLIDLGLMTPAGFDSIEKAKQNGSWVILDEVEELNIPQDLEDALQSQPNAKAYFESLSRSVKKSMLQWLVLAKRPETRQKE